MGEVTVYNSRLDISPTGVFENCPKVRLKGYDQSTAQTYADEQGIPFESMGEAPYVVVESGSCGTGLRWTLGDDDVLRVTGSGAMKDYTSSSLAPWADIAIDVFLPEGLTRIGNAAFYYPYYNYALQNVNIPTTVKSIGNFAFASCRNLAKIEIPMGVEEIGASAFSLAYALKTVDLPESVAVLGDSIFNSCRELESVTIRNRNAQIGSDAFKDCNKLTLRGHSGSTTQIYADEQGIPFEALPADWSAPTYAWSEDLNAVTATRYFDGDLAQLETETVEATRVLSVAPTQTTAGQALWTSVAFENPAFEVQTTIQRIPALNDMDVLYLPGDLQKIEASTFENLSCQAVIVPSSCVEIESRAFAGCEAILYVRLPQSANVAQDAFEGCDAVFDYGE